MRCPLAFFNKRDNFNRCSQVWQLLFPSVLDSDYMSLFLVTMVFCVSDDPRILPVERDRLSFRAGFKRVVGVLDIRL